MKQQHQQSGRRAAAGVSGIVDVLGSGWAWVAAFVLLANGNAVFSARLLQDVYPFTLLFWAFLITSTLFAAGLVAAGGLRAVAIAWVDLRTLAEVNVLSALNWVGYFIALRFLAPVVVTAIVCGIGPLFMTLYKPSCRRARASRYSALAIVTGTVLLSWISFTGSSGIASLSAEDAVVGIVLAVMAGVCQALTLIATKKLGSRGWSAARIVVHRFYVLIPLSAVMCIVHGSLLPTRLGAAAGIAEAAAFGVALPIWCLQRGILSSSPFFVAVMLALGPVCTYLFQGLDNRIQWSLPSAIGCLLIFASVFAGIARNRK